VFMTNCIGRHKCKQTRTVWKLTRDMNCDVNVTYKAVSNYAYMEYSCIESKNANINLFMFIDVIVRGG
jgi:hypothetical protein